MNDRTPTAPSYLDGDLRARFDALAPDLIAMGTLTWLDVDALARYVLSENEYLQASKLVLDALSACDAAAADKWASVQDRLLKQCMTAGAEFGLLPTARRTRGLTLPR